MRLPACALYAFCRMADDAVDESGDPHAVDGLRARLDQAYAGAPHDSPIDRAFSRLVRDPEPGLAGGQVKGDLGLGGMGRRNEEGKQHEWEHSAQDR